MKLELCWVCSTEFVPTLLIAARKSLCKNIAPFQIDTVRNTEKTRENSDTFQICVLKSRVFTSQKVEGYIYGHVIYTRVLPSSLMSLRSGLHPSMLTNTAPSADTLVLPSGNTTPSSVTEATGKTQRAIP